MFFVDRTDAGRRLGARLLGRRGPGLVVVGASPGGVVVGAEVARALEATLDPSLTGDRPDQRAASLAGRTAIVVDEGLLTGATARAACRAVRARGAALVVLAVPVAPAGWIDGLAGVADDHVSVATPTDLRAVAEAYHELAPVTDDELQRARREPPPQGLALVRDEDVTVRTLGLALPGRLRVPARAIGAVVFAHGAGSSHASPRNQRMAEMLNEARVATLLVDLLAADEVGDRAKGYAIDLLGARIVGATRWLRGEPGLDALPVGYVGASTGAPAALWAVTEGGSDAVAVVARGGRADLAQPWLDAVRCPVLLIVGAHDDQVLALNREAMFHLHGEVRLAVVPDATHLFAEPGTLERCAGLARDFLVRQLLRAQRSLAASTPAASSAAMRSSS